MRSGGDDPAARRRHRKALGDVQFANGKLRKLQRELRAEEADPDWRSKLAAAKAALAEADQAVQVEEQKRLKAQNNRVLGGGAKTQDLDGVPRENRGFEYRDSADQHPGAWQMDGVMSVPLGRGLVAGRPSIRLTYLRGMRDEARTLVDRLQRFARDADRLHLEKEASVELPIMRRSREQNAARFAAKRAGYPGYEKIAANYSVGARRHRPAPVEEA
jgi:hypothetical protein